MEACVCHFCHEPAGFKVKGVNLCGPHSVELTKMVGGVTELRGLAPDEIRDLADSACLPIEEPVADPDRSFSPAEGAGKRA